MGSISICGPSSGKFADGIDRFGRAPIRRRRKTPYDPGCRDSESAASGKSFPETGRFGRAPAPGVRESTDGLRKRLVSCLRWDRPRRGASLGRRSDGIAALWEAHEEKQQRVRFGRSDEAAKV